MRMSLYTSTIAIFPQAPYLSWAQFLAALAYPIEVDEARRLEYAAALQIWLVRRRMTEEREWGHQPQLILPLLVTGDSFKRYGSEEGAASAPEQTSLRQLYSHAEYCGRLLEEIRSDRRICP